MWANVPPLPLQSESSHVNYCTTFPAVPLASSLAPNLFHTLPQGDTFKYFRSHPSFAQNSSMVSWEHQCPGHVPSPFTRTSQRPFICNSLPQSLFLAGKGHKAEHRARRRCRMVKTLGDSPPPLMAEEMVDRDNVKASSALAPRTPAGWAQVLPVVTSSMIPLPLVSFCFLSHVSTPLTVFLGITSHMKHAHPCLGICI